MEELHALGVSLSIDDFGTGYSSLKYLRELPVAELKVDRSSVSGLGEHVRDESICASVVSMALQLGLKVVAEGVETDAQQQRLHELGCDYVQGYYICRPKEPAEVADFLRRAVTSPEQGRRTPRPANTTTHLPAQRDRRATQADSAITARSCPRQP